MTELNPNPVIKGFDATTLKLLAIVAMVIDHTAWAFVPTNSIWGQVMHAIGRLTFPIMAFFIAEGFFYTRNFKKYLFRMLGFAILSHFAFQYFNFGRIPLFTPVPGESIFYYLYSSVLYPFSLGLACLWVMKRWQTSYPLLKYFVVFVLCVLAYPGDYLFFAPVLVMLFGQGHGNRTQQLQSGALVIGYLVIVSLQSGWQENMYMLATFFPLLLIKYYDGTQGSAKNELVKYGFYIFYPLHLFILGFIKYQLLHQSAITRF
ncbi:MAG: TraX family protein [Clostridiaceae bacterium]